MRMTSVQAKELQYSDVWQAFCGEIDSRLSLLYSNISTCKVEELVALQARIKQLQEVKNIPQDVVDSES